MINVELGRPANTWTNLNDGAIRKLAGKPTGPISFADLRGKTFYPTGVLVAGTQTIGSRPEVGFRDAVIGSLSDMPGAPARPFFVAEYRNQDNSFQSSNVFFSGDVSAALAGKAVYVNDLRIAMNAPTVGTFWGNLETQWTSPNRFGFAVGYGYAVRIG